MSHSTCNCRVAMGHTQVYDPTWKAASFEVVLLKTLLMSTAQNQNEALLLRVIYSSNIVHCRRVCDMCMCRNVH